MHVPVLAESALAWLDVREGGTYVDCTAGGGGHAEGIARRLTQGRLIALDRDPAAVAKASERLSAFPCAKVLHRNYGELGEVLDELALTCVDGVLFDLGISSMQLDTPHRGFSFQADGPLDMRMDTSSGVTAAELLMTLDERALARLLREYGDVRPAKRIAAAIRRRTAGAGIATTGDLKQAVEEALDFVKGVPEEVRTVFQALRMAVNEELRWLKSGLEQAIDVLAPGGRLVTIAFHSGEDRIVKMVTRAASRPRHERYPDGRTRAVFPARLKVLTRKPIGPDAAEISANPRAHSARLRAFEKLAEEGGCS